ncbi:hypothetical protein ACVGV7_00255, partial [Enterobacter intestinihominis]
LQHASSAATEISPPPVCSLLAHRLYMHRMQSTAKLQSTPPKPLPGKDKNSQIKRQNFDFLFR